jgi:hypothetical protein
MAKNNYIAKRTHAQTRIMYQNLDWSLQNVVLAKQVGQTPDNVGTWRTKLGKPLALTHGKQSYVPVRPHKKLDALAELDWSLSDSVLAKQIGKSRQYLNQCRKSLGIPRSKLVKTL